MTQDNATTDTLLTNFETWLKGHGRSVHSMRAYVSDVRQFIAWFAQHTKLPFALSAVTGEDVGAWRSYLADNAMPATVNRKLAALSPSSAGPVKPNWSKEIQRPTSAVSSSSL